MQLTNMCVATLLRRHPWAEEVLEWHGVDTGQVDGNLTLGALCAMEALDAEKLERDVLSTELLEPVHPVDAVDEDVWDEPLEPESKPDDHEDRWWDDYVDHDIEQGWLH